MIHYIGKSDTFQTLEADVIFSPHNMALFLTEKSVAQALMFIMPSIRKHTAGVSAHTCTHTHAEIFTCKDNSFLIHSLQAAETFQVPLIPWSAYRVSDLNKGDFHSFFKTF